METPVVVAAVLVAAVGGAVEAVRDQTVTLCRFEDTLHSVRIVRGVLLHRLRIARHLQGHDHRHRSSFSLAYPRGGALGEVRIGAGPSLARCPCFLARVPLVTG